MKKVISSILAVSMMLSAVSFSVFAEADDNAMPDHYDLRELGVVTPIKNQSPWGACWSFAACAAIETSILSKMGLTYEEFPIDLSERHLAWMAGTPVSEEAVPSQAGEGMYSLKPNLNPIDLGGTAFSASNIFAMATGPIEEEEIPYYGIDEDGKPSYSTDADWSVDDEYRQYYTYLFRDVTELKRPGNRNPLALNTEFLTPEGYIYDEEATNEIKAELLKGNAVAVQFFADTSHPDEIGDLSKSQFINLENFAHYTYTPLGINHGVTIVGYDDNYSKENFLTKAYNTKTGSYIDVPQPPADGAWIVKNSWGSVNADPESHDYNDWGYEGSGYFYISYYDQSLDHPQVYDFDYEVPEELNIFGYDFMSNVNVQASPIPTETIFGNIFEVDTDADQEFNSFSFLNALLGVNTKIEIYEFSGEPNDPREGKLLFSSEYKDLKKGYHRFDIDKGIKLKPGSKVAVLQTITDDDGNYYMPVNYHLTKEYAEANAKTLGIDVYAITVINPGESIAFLDGKWGDMSTLKESYAQKGLAIDNFPIRMYTVDAESEEEEDTSSDDSSSEEDTSSVDETPSEDISSDESVIDKDVSDVEPDDDQKNPPTGNGIAYPSLAVISISAITAFAVILSKKRRED